MQTKGLNAVCFAQMVATCLAVVSLRENPTCHALEWEDFQK